MIERQEEGEESGTLGMEAFCHSPDRLIELGDRVPSKTLIMSTVTFVLPLLLPS